MKANCVQIQPRVIRSKPGSVTCQIGQPVTQHPAQAQRNNVGLFGGQVNQTQRPNGTKTDFQTRFVLNKKAVISIKPMQFKRFVFTQSGRTETIEKGIAHQYLFFAEPKHPVTLTLTLETPQLPMNKPGCTIINPTKATYRSSLPELKNRNLNTCTSNEFTLDIFCVELPNDGRFKTFEVYPLEEGISDEFMKEIQDFLQNFEKTPGEGNQGKHLSFK